MKNEKMSALDGLRAIACILVIISHIPSHLSQASSLFVFNFSLGSPGVAIFFCLSGFLMAKLYSELDPSYHNVKKYLLSRFIRILPAYTIVILVSYFVVKLFDSNFIFQITDHNLARHLLLIGSEAVFWSIPPEVQFYIFFVFIWVAIKRSSIPLRVTLVTSVVVMMLTRDMWPGILLPSKLHFFLLGAFAGFLRNKEQINDLVNKHIYKLQITSLLLIGLAVSQLPREEHFYTNSLFFIPTTILVYTMSYSSKISSLLFGNNLFSLIGKVSFTIYLTHDIVIYYLNILFNKYQYSGYTTDITTLILCILIPTAISIIVELPLCNFLKKILISNCEQKNIEGYKKTTTS